MFKEDESNLEDKHVDLFVGIWRLDPAQSVYEFGTPPRSGLYTIEVEDDGYLIAMKWESSEGEVFSLSYSAVPDGIDYPYENPDVAETVSMTRIDEHTLDSESKKDGQTVGYARRILSADSLSMTIIQSGRTLDGKAYENLSVYRREISLVHSGVGEGATSIGNG